MMDERRAMRALEAHLEDAIGVEEATVIADRLESYVTRAYLDRALEEQTRRLSDELTGTLTA